MPLQYEGLCERPGSLVNTGGHFHRWHSSGQRGARDAAQDRWSAPMDLVAPLITAVSVVIGTGGIVLVFREWLWLRFCRDIHDKAVDRGQNPKPEVIIQAAREGHLGRSPKQRQLPAAPKSNSKSLAA
jgi:hypothetical protein